MAVLLIDQILKWLVVAALVYGVIVAATHWAVRNQRIAPFGGWARAVRRASDPVIRPLERRVVRGGGNPQDAPYWLLGLIVVSGLLLITLFHWAVGFVLQLGVVAQSGPGAWIYLLIHWTFQILMFALIVRVIASWLGLSRYSPWMRPVMLLTDWLVEPIRRIVPPLGMFDLSPFVAYIVLWIGEGLVMRLLASIL